MRVTNARGQEFELVGGEWVPVTTAQATQVSAGGASGAQSEAPKLTTGPINAAMIGAGDVFNTIGINARELWAKARGDLEGQAIAQEDRTEAGQRRAALQAEAPIASAIGGALPTLATLPLGLGAGTGAGMLAARLGTGSQLGRIAESVALGGLTGAATSETGDIAGAGGIGAGLGGVGAMAGQMVGRVNAARIARNEAQQAGAMAGTLTGGERDILDAAQRAGMRVTPGQAAGSRQMRQLEAGLSSNPWTARPFAEIDDANRAQLNTLAARAIGAEADNVGPAVRQQAADAIGGRFREVAKEMGSVDTAPLKRALQSIEAEEGTAVFPLLEVKSLLRRFSEGEAGRVAASGGEEGATLVTGQALMRERSRIAKQMRDAFAANNSDRGELYGRVLDAIDETARKALVENAGSAGAARAAALYDTARDQWNVLRALDRGGASPDGNVLAGQAARLVAQGDKTRYARGGLKGTGQPGESPLGDFYDALRFSSSQIGRPIVGDSGTATRSAVMGILQGGSLTGSAAGMLRNLTVSPVFRAYAGMSPEAARTAQATLEGMRAAQGRAGSAGGAAARQAGSAWDQFNGGN